MTSPDIAGSAHAADDAAVGHQPLELLAGVLAALIRVVLVRLAAPPHGHQQSVRDQLGVMPALIDQPTTRRENRSITAAT